MSIINQQALMQALQQMGQTQKNAANGQGGGGVNVSLPNLSPLQQTVSSPGDDTLRSLLAGNPSSISPTLSADGSDGVNSIVSLIGKLLKM